MKLTGSRDFCEGCGIPVGRADRHKTRTGVMHKQCADTILRELTSSLRRAQRKEPL